MAIGVDIDEILFPTRSYFGIFLNLKYNKNFSGEELQGQEYGFEFYKIYGLTKEQALKNFYEFARTVMFREMQPFPEALLGVIRLKRLRDLHIVSSRQEFLRNITEQQIERHFSGMFSAIHLGNLLSYEGSSTKKQAICMREGIELLVEDSPEQALEVSQAIPVVLFDKPWNRHIQETARIKIARTWPEIVEKTEMILNPSSQS